MCPGWYGSSSSNSLDRGEVHHPFLDKEERGCLEGFGWMNFARAKVFIYELICGFLFLD